MRILPTRSVISLSTRSLFFCCSKSCSKTQIVQHRKRGECSLFGRRPAKQANDGGYLEAVNNKTNEHIAEHEKHDDNVAQKVDRRAKRARSVHGGVHNVVPCLSSHQLATPCTQLVSGDSTVVVVYG